MEFRILPSKVSKHKKQAKQQEQYSRKNCLLVHRIKEVSVEATDDIIIKTIRQNVDIDIPPHVIERSHRISQPRQPGEKQCPIIVKFVQYYVCNRIFRNKKKLDNRKLYSKQNGKIERSTGATWFS